MVIEVKISGVIRKLNNLPREMNKQISNGGGEFMRSVQKSAKLRAPRDTTELADSIKIEKIKNGWKLIVNSPHGIYQEEGFKPHWIHSDMVRNSNKLKRGGFFFVGKSRPFVRPALEHNLSNLPNILSKSTKQAVTQLR